MKSKLLSRLPGIHWAPSDLPSNSPDSSSKPKEKPRYVFALRPGSHPSPSTITTIGSGSTPLPTSHRRTRRKTPRTTSHSDPLFDARTLGQGQSMFFARLPFELRTMIYEYVVGAETIHLTMASKKRVGHFICEDHAPRGRECTCRILVGGRDTPRLDAAGARLLRTCRRMYTELLPPLYSLPTFSLLHATHLLFLPTLLPSPSLQHIRVLHLRWALRALPYFRRTPSHPIAYPEDTRNWEKGWDILAGMRGLRELYVVLVDPSPMEMWERSWVEVHGRLLESVRGLERVGGLRWCEVVLPYESCSVEWEGGSTSVVKLRRPSRRDAEEQE